MGFLFAGTADAKPGAAGPDQVSLTGTPYVFWGAPPPGSDLLLVKGYMNRRGLLGGGQLNDVLAGRFVGEPHGLQGFVGDAPPDLGQGQQQMLRT